MHDPTDFVEHLEGAARRIADGGSPSDVFRALLDGVSTCAPRTAMFLARRGTLNGWALRGYGESAVGRLRATEIVACEGWPGRVLDDQGAERAFRTAEDRGDAVRLDDRLYPESLAHVIHVGGRVLALVLAERDSGERPWSPAGMNVLVTMARMRLEVDLARRRLARLSSDVDRGREDDPSTSEPDRTASVPDRPESISPHSVTRSEPEPDVAAVEPAVEARPTIAPVPDDRAAPPAPPPPASSDVSDSVRRFARLVATDIRLYNEEEVVLGRRNGDLGERMKEQIERGRETFRRRFPDLGKDGERVLHDAFVQVLAGGDCTLLDSVASTGPGGGSGS